MAADTKKSHRVLALKLEFDWKDPESKTLFARLRELGWQSAHYYNYNAMAKYAERQGWRQRESDDPAGVSKEIRSREKGELSGAAYSAIEREVQGAFQRDGGKIYYGQPYPQRRPTGALVVRGHKNKAESGIRIELEDEQYVAYLQAQSAKSEGGSWLRLPIARNTRRDERQGPILDAMVRWETPIRKASVQLKPHKVILRLSYSLERALPAMGERTATLGPLFEERLILRSEAGHTKDYSSRLAEVRRRKDDWDQIRRRVTAQIGWRHGQARRKRERLASLSWDDWLNTYLHTWTKEIATWCQSQGAATIRVESISDGDWPADKFQQLLTYKAEDLGITVVEGADVQDASGERAARATVQRTARKVKKRREAERELQHQLGRES